MNFLISFLAKVLSSANNFNPRPRAEGDLAAWLIDAWLHISIHALVQRAAANYAIIIQGYTISGGYSL